MKTMIRSLLLLGMLAALRATPALGYIEALMPLKNVMKESTVIAEGVIEKADAGKKIATLKITRTLKGKCAYERIKMNCSAGKFWHSDVIMRHMVVGAPAIIFYNDGLAAEVYLNRFFLQIHGAAAETPEKTWWNYHHIEIRMNRAFNGTVDDLRDTVEKTLAGKGKPPAAEARIPVITRQSVDELPAFGEPIDEAKIPLPFRKFDPTLKPDAGPIAVNGEGFIRRWLILGPIPLGNAANDPGAALSKEWLPGLRNLTPGPTEKATVADLELRWDVADCSDYFLDMGGSENSITIAVTYILCEDDAAEVTLRTGSDDHAAWWLNGREVQRFIGGRGVEKDQDRTPEPVTLKKGVNVLMAAVINGGGPTAACARFVDKANAPLAKLRAGAERPQ